ncbi:class I SAM-dependent methyltransferase [Polymorphobacter sp.]|uniref:class I SAM-dependent methyltransferase n=1 Tax=Polymorphobacter sp. TaxID=1909290 RepID=UPI003F72E99B
MASTVAFTPNHDESARQAFVGSLKEFINFKLESTLQQSFDEVINPAVEARTGRPLADRDEAGAVLDRHPLYQLWESLTFHSQNLMWKAVQDTTDRTIDDQVEAFRARAASPNRRGSMRLADRMVHKAPITTTEIHRQPGGYWRETRPDDIETALNYSGTVDLYRNAKGMGAGGKLGSDSIGRMLTAAVRRRAPDLQPKAILDMGCGTGEQTLAYKREFPDAEVTGIDCARPFIRFAHGFAESQDVAVHFAEMDAGETDFPDASFDLIVSIIMFHETSRAQVRQILAESHRLLRPGGLLINLDVPYHAHRIPLLKQVTNHWQVRHNGEPFWSGFTALDMREELVAAGFVRDAAFADHEQVGPATYFFFGGRK